MNRWAVTTTTGLVCVLLISLFCSAPDPNSPFITSIRGDVSIVRMNKNIDITTDQMVFAGDTIRVGDGQSGAILKFINGTMVYLNVGTVLTIDAFSKESKTVTFVHGECYYTQESRNSGNDTIVLKVQSGVIRGTEADFLTYYNSDVRELISTVLLGTVQITNNRVDEQIVPCSRYSEVENEKGQLQPPSVGEIELLKLWVNTSLIDRTLSKSGCTLQALASENIPPKWVTLPEEFGQVGVIYSDTIKADDPEGNAIRYTLLQSPDGMNLDEETGVISYTPKSAGTFAVKIEATDSESEKIQHEYSIIISQKAFLRLNIHGNIRHNTPVTFSAQVQNKPEDEGKYLYRFDTDGDGKFDVPSGGSYDSKSAVKNYRFTKEGVFTVVAEAKSSKGTTLRASKKVVVNAPPAASITVKPVFVTASSEALIDASGSTDTKNSIDQLRMRFDVDGDGTWDIPSEGKFTKGHTFSHVFSRPGDNRIIVQVYDEQGLWDTASAKIFVSRGLAIDAINGLDTANVGDSLSFSCDIADPEFPINEYDWSVSGPEPMNISKNEQRIKIALRKEGTYHLSCAVIDSKEQKAVASRTFVIINSRTIIDAGGPYKVSVNSLLSVEGTASDKDSKISNYSWDFDRDGTADTQSVDNGSATWTFKKGGIKKILFSVQTSDGTITTAEADVEVINTAPEVDAGKDILARSGRKVKLSGTAKDLENNICEYAWDFEGDGTFDWTSPDTGFVEHQFKEYSNPVFRVTDCDGALSTDTIKVVVCPEGMEVVENGKFCIDTYEWPNKKNEMPMLEVTYEEAAKLCSDAGKRLCTATEYETACTSDKEKWVYPYGRRYKVDNCNNLGNGFSKNKPSTSGYFQDCAGPTGAYDMSGNAAEWVDAGDGAPYVYGGSWQNGPNSSKCNSKVQLEPDKKYFYVSFRCCK